ncbi:hypothetical protein [Phenylobacterium sp.]|uniref:hypothetical protein n=1 Tax=Phenylobacterium sp. TaxID=1871053 RepID=UPI00273798C2|nr:hypothetical protein [Phenylobacterium sp.]MDP3869929.1 hypothetical protein [Phenylobacterium sp.]
MLTQVPATLQHVRDLLPTLRPEDARELQSSSGGAPFVSMVRAIGLSDWSVAALDEDNLPVVLFGLARLDEGVGTPWMVASTKITQHALQVARFTRPIVAKMNRDYPILWNRADLRNSLHLKWLRWAGFRFGALVDAPDGSPFIEFSRIPTNV